MTKQRWGIVALGLITVLVSAFFLFKQSNSEAPQYKIGVLLAGDSRVEKLDGLKKGLSDLGYDPESFQFTVLNGKDEQQQIPELSKKLVRGNLDVIVAMGAIEALELKKQMDSTDKEIPVVFAGISAPMELGLIDDYRKPGGSFTGIDNNHLGLSAKRLEMLVKLVPKVRRVAIIYDGSLDVSNMSLKEAIDAAQKLGVPFITFDISTPGLLGKLEAQTLPTDGLLILLGHQIEASTRLLVDFADRHHLPSMGIYEGDVKDGYLIGYGASYFNQGYQAARHVSLLLKGNDPAVIPVELPDNVRFLINERKVEDLGIKLDPDTRQIADLIGNESEGGRPE